VHLQLVSQTNRADSLEQLKRETRDALQALAKRLAVPSLDKPVAFPDGYQPSDVQTALAEIAGVCQSPPDVLLDISALPRRVIVVAFRQLRKLQHEQAVANVYTAYAWAAGYPSNALPFEVGRLRTIESARPLDEFLPGKSDECWAVLFPGRQGFDAKQFVDQLPASRHVRVLAFMNRRGVLRSLDMLRANSSILVDSAFEVTYYLTLREARSRLLDWASIVPLRDRASYLIAPLGPKPLVLCGAEALDIVRGRLAEAHIRGSGADLVVLGSTDYVSTYSEGSGDLSIFDWEGL
jgi:hypothetical protein